MASIEAKAMALTNTFEINRCIEAAFIFYWTPGETNEWRRQAEYRRQAKPFCQTGKTAWIRLAP
ncbi:MULTISPECIES: hypothetical protein [unclassified Pseudomonas]|uniref:hypothetical protein n=1 Tax=unclassified Pseudomonas TaxID=196821 RepID=UPI0028AEB572|nr:hypothetical protein [Pseudomonas sp.]